MDRPKQWRPWLAYSALRLLCFAVPLAAVYAVSGNLVLSAIIAAIIGLCLSVILLGRPRSAVVEPLSTRKPTRQADEDVEDLAVDAADQNASAAPRPKP